MLQSLAEMPRESPAKDAMAAASEVLHNAVSASAVGRERDWANRVAQALAQVERDLQRHSAAAQTTDGPLAAVDRTRPSLFRQWNILCLHYRDLLRRVRRLRDEVEHAVQAFKPVGEALEAAATAPSNGAGTRGVPVFGAIREQAAQIVDDLERSREAETALVLESVNTDIGVGD